MTDTTTEHTHASGSLIPDLRAHIEIAHGLSLHTHHMTDERILEIHDEQHPEFQERDPEAPGQREPGTWTLNKANGDLRIVSDYTFRTVAIVKESWRYGISNARLIAKAPELATVIRDCAVLLAIIADDPKAKALGTDATDAAAFLAREGRALLAEIDG